MTGPPPAGGPRTFGRRIAAWWVVFAATTLAPPGAFAQVPVVTASNFTVRVMAANLTDNDQTYEPYAIRIFQGLKPDIVAIQEFNYSNNAAPALRTFVDTAFGTNFHYFRESAAGYSIPNGVISRWPFLATGQWEDTDTGVNDRGYAWARIDLPGTNDLYVVSIHLKASSGASNEARRAAEAAEIKSNIVAQFPSNAWIVVAGDCNIDTSTETALATFKTFLSDSPIPTDATSGGDPDTNNGRSERYDYVFANLPLRSNQVGSVLGGQTFPNGLVFDSRVFTPLSAVAPVQSADSGFPQHMAVIKDFQGTALTTNFVSAPVVHLPEPGLLQWAGAAGLAYTVFGSADLTNWSFLGMASSPTTNFLFTNHPGALPGRYYRVRYP